MTLSNDHDAVCENHGSVWQFYFVTPVARQWVDANVSYEPWQGSNRLLAMDWRCGAALVLGMLAAGLKVVDRA